MANPELRRDRDLDADWIRYAQSRLEMHLRAAVAAGEVEVSATRPNGASVTRKLKCIFDAKEQ